MIALHYKDICLIPKYSTLCSRKDADTTIKVGDFRFKLPVIPSPMACVVDEEKCRWLAENGYMYVMHRFDVNIFDFVKSMQDTHCSISVGVKQRDRELLKRIVGEGLRIDTLTIDIAHGHSVHMENMVNFIYSLGDVCNILVAGNVATPDGYLFLSEDLKVDGVRVGIGGGSPCSTKNKTGFTYPMYSCIKDIVSLVPKKAMIIADGGIREHGDIAKALNAGADMVMAGGLFSRLVDSPAEMVNGKKVYYGSASQENKGQYTHVEGKKLSLNIEPMTYEEKLKEIEEDLKSAISYAGGRDLYDLKKCKAIQVSEWEL